MLRITVNRSASGAKKYYSETYYSEGKKKQDYYSEKDHAIGKWGGKGAERLGLTSDIDKSDFASLCDNLIPGTKQQLTERNNAERRVGYDFTFNASKSVSLLYTFATTDEKQLILKAFGAAVKEAMSEIETGMLTRVRQNGKNENRETGNIVYGEFTHFTSRPVGETADPHLHAHCFVLNATYDPTEQKWKAGEFGQINKDAPYYEAIFHASLANKLKGLGYEIEAKATGFEIKGIPRDLIEKFSRRTVEIEKVAKQKNITGKDAKANLGAWTRESKRNTNDRIDEFKEWDDRLTVKEKELLRNLRTECNNEGNGEGAKEAIGYSLNHHLERKSVTTDKEVLTTAIKSSLGIITVNEIKKAFLENTSVIKVNENHQNFLTTKEALHEENKLIENAHAFKGRFKPINEGYQIKTEFLNSEQRDAIYKALTTLDGITIIAGKAGTGKTTLMKEVQGGIRESHKEIFAFAPSAEASRGVQRKEGFGEAETLAALFQSKELQNKLKDGVVWVDEGGMLSNKDMNHLLKIASEQNARLIITGDTKQHTSVERGDALRTLQQEAGIVPIQISKIQRQKGQHYKEAVSSLSKGDTDKGFRKLDMMGAIHEISDKDERIGKIAADYVSSSYKGSNGKQPTKEVLVVSPTHAEGEKVTEQIRLKLKEANILGKTERTFTSFKSIQLTTAEKSRAESYEAGKWIGFHQNISGFKAGSRYEITGSAKDSILVKDSTGKSLSVPIEKSKNYNVFEARDISLSQNDRVRFTGNGKTKDGKHLFNGTSFIIAGFDKEGNIKRSDGSIISKDFGHFTHGYVMTSHASQGKTMDKVIISQSSMSFRASSKEQFYVSVSRGKQSVAIYTDDKADLLRAVSQSSERRSATELIRQKELQNSMEVTRIGFLRRIRERTLEAVEKVKGSINKSNVGYGLQGKTSTRTPEKAR